MFDKRILVSTAVGAGAKSVAIYIRDVLKHWGFNRCYSLALSCPASNGKYQFKTKTVHKIKKIACRFYDDVAGKRQHPPTVKCVMFYNARRSLVKLAENSGGVDSAF